MNISQTCPENQKDVVGQQILFVEEIRISYSFYFCVFEYKFRILFQVMLGKRRHEDLSFALLNNIYNGLMFKCDDRGLNLVCVVTNKSQLFKCLML